MATFVMLTTLTPAEMRSIKANPCGLRAVDREAARLGITVLEQWATLGAFDVLSVLDAPDEHAMAHLSLQLSARGFARYDSLAAIPVEELVAALPSRPLDPEHDALGAYR